MEVALIDVEFFVAYFATVYVFVFVSWHAETFYNESRLTFFEYSMLMLATIYLFLYTSNIFFQRYRMHVKDAKIKLTTQPVYLKDAQSEHESA